MADEDKDSEPSDEEDDDWATKKEGLARNMVACSLVVWYILMDVSC